MRDLKLSRLCRCCHGRQSHVEPALSVPQMPPHPDLAALVEEVSTHRLRKTVAELSRHPTRHTLSRHVGEVAEWLEERFLALGYDDVRRLPIRRSIPHLERKTTFFNVRCRKPGLHGAPMRIVCAHFDSCVQNSLDSASRAPGANDNATGVAVMLELARLLKDVSLSYPVVFLATSGEEQGLWGSTHYAAMLRKTDTHVRFLLNLDEVGFPNEAGEVVVEYDRSKPVANNRTSKRIASEVAAVASHLGIRTKMGAINNSDYMPFQSRGYVTIGLFESGDYEDFRHTGQDEFGQVKFWYVARVTKVALAALLHPFPTAADEGQEI
jgi:hypothetical protein